MERESSRRAWAYIRVLHRIEYWLQGASDGRLNRILVQHDVASPHRDVVSTTAITLPRFVELSLFTHVFEVWGQKMLDKYRAGIYQKREPYMRGGSDICQPVTTSSRPRLESRRLEL